MNDVVFVIGFVGMGKIYIVVVLVVKVFKNWMVKKIIFIRLAVEVGESLGFFLVILRKRLIFILGFFMMFWMICFLLKSCSSLWLIGLLKLCFWYLCVGVYWIMYLLFWMRCRIVWWFSLRCFWFVWAC